MYKENQTVEIEMFDTTITIVCDIDWNGLSHNSEVYIKSINGLPISIFDEDELWKIERHVLSNEFNKNVAEILAKAEARGDEERGN